MAIGEQAIPVSPLGCIPTKWTTARLRELTVKIGTGATPRGGSAVYLPARSNWALIRSQNVFDRRFAPEGLSFISEHHAEQLSNAVVEADDVLLNITGDGVTFSRACLAPATCLPACVNQHVAIIRTRRERCHPGYLLSYLTHPSIKEYIEAFNSGGSRRAITKGHIESFVVPLPPLREQEAIAHILGTLDDKIELNQRMNETLEAMTRALFKSWFVDFDPVRAKMAGRRPAGMDQATADLFPDSFQDSPLGKIPKGWRVARLSEHVEAIKGLSYKGAGLSDTGVPLHNLNSVYEGGGYKFEGIKHYVGEYRDRHIIRPDDLIVTNTEQGHDCLLIGYAAIVPRMFGDWGLFSHHIYRVRPLDGSPVTESYLCYLLNSPAMHDTVSGYGNGTTVNMLPVAGLQHPQFLLPPSEPIQKFSDFATHVLGRRERMVTENRTLAALRDALLPKLLSGEIRVSGAEHKTRGLRQ